MECQRRGRADSHQYQWMVADAPAQCGGRAGDVRKRQVRAEVGIVAFRVAGSVIVEAQAGDTVGRQPSGHLREEAITACVLVQYRWTHQHLGTRRAHCGMQHAEQPALLVEKVEWLHAHEDAAKGPGIQATKRAAGCKLPRTLPVTNTSFP